MKEWGDLNMPKLALYQNRSFFILPFLCNFTNFEKSWKYALTNFEKCWKYALSASFEVVKMYIPWKQLAVFAGFWNL